MRNIYQFLIVTLVFVGSGCSVISTNLGSIETIESAKKILKKRSLIYGRIISEAPGYMFTMHVQNQQTKYKYSLTGEPANKLFSSHKQDNKEGYFFKALPPGDYKWTRGTFTDYGYIGDFKVDIDFIIPENSAVYLGTIIFQWSKMKNYLVMQTGNVSYKIADDNEIATYRLWNRFPELKGANLKVILNVLGSSDSDRFIKKIEGEVATDLNTRQEQDYKYESIKLKVASEQAVGVQ